MRYMKRFQKYILVLFLLIVPKMVFASTGEDDIPLYSAFLIESFVTIHMSLFVIHPLSELISQNNKRLFWTLFFIRIGILIFFDLFVTTYIAIADIIILAVGAFIVTPILSIFVKKPLFSLTNNKDITVGEQNALKCKKCNTLINSKDKFCSGCGTKLTSKNVLVTISNKEKTKKNAIKQNEFAKIYNMNEDQMLESVVKKEMSKIKYTISNKEIPSELKTRATILNVFFAFLVFVFIVSIFVHYPIYTYFIEIIILLAVYKTKNKINIINYLKKQVKLRPEEKISNVLMSIKSSSVPYDSKKQLITFLLIVILVSIPIFATPKILYEKTEGGYAVRYYVAGLTNFTSVKIPETYKNEKVVSLRGNTFSNMPFLREVSLPDSIVEIRGQAFKNCLLLKKVNIPKNLEYLGGGAFYNAMSIDDIELPDTLTYLGGEAFYGAKSLKNIKLSENLPEIRGDTFEYCTSLETITIPDSVSRIGGHAFYGDTSLKEVKLNGGSRLREIGSSAFRQCKNLHKIYLPMDTYVNERAFKESPTIIEELEYEKPKPLLIDGKEGWISDEGYYQLSEKGIIVGLSSFTYDEAGMTYGSMDVDLNDGVNDNLVFHFALSREEDREQTNLVSFPYENYFIIITDYNQNGVFIKVTKNDDYSENYQYLATVLFRNPGDEKITSFNNHKIKLENITNKMGRMDYYISYDGQPCNNSIGNGFNNSTICSDNAMIRIDTMYQTGMIYAKIFYN